MRPFPEPGAKWQISSEGGYFEQRFEKSVFPFEASYDPSPDGQRFLVVMPPEGEAAATQINMVLSWSDELRRLIHAEK